ncbi:MAG: M18 family aminopeptidase [Oscillospiraceae bacterium]|nr:M18 family aminopeptidase [Oscillospiraceae bacterium]
MDRINRELLDFIEESPTAWHAAANVAAELEAAGYTRIYEDEDWELSLPGKYYVVRNSSSLIALNLPAEVTNYLIMAAHDDAPSFRIKIDGEETTLGLYTRLGVEKYGGMLCSTWLDRPLSVAGRVAVREDGRIRFKLVNFKRDLVLIPNLAIHMDRSANDDKSYNINVDMMPLLGSAGLKTGFAALVAQELGVKEEDVITRELNLYTRTRGTVWGAENEYVSAPRLDDLQCVFACLKGFLQAEKPRRAAVLCILDNEEVGSKSRQGADSTFLDDVLFRVYASLGHSPAQYRSALARSFMVSADNAHAVHPNRPEFADRNERPAMNGGIVFKYNANQRYITDGISAAIFGEVCKSVGVPIQRYSNRPDLHGGTTMGNISLAHVSIPALDIGLAQLAMHSSYETAGAKDTEYLIRAAGAFFASDYQVQRESASIV